jgi:pilus assembly protein Flp/PilA
MEAWIIWQKRQRKKVRRAQVDKAPAEQEERRMRLYPNKILTFLRDEDGASAIEYALLVALIALVITVAATALGTNTARIFTNSSSKLSSAS